MSIDIILGNNTDDGAITIEIGNSAYESAFTVSSRLDGVPQDFDVLHFANRTVRDIALDKLIAGLLGDGYVVLDQTA